MARTSGMLLLVLAALVSAEAARIAASSKAHVAGSHLRAGMRPEIVAKSLAKVEDEWKSQFRLYVECNATATSRHDSEKCNSAPRAFEHACGTIVSAVVKASNGDHTVVREYMDDICGEPELKGWREGRCRLLATTVLTGMTEDSYDNRERLNAAPLCQSFWLRFATEEQELMKKETLEREAQEKKREEEREELIKRAAEEQVAEEKRQREEEEAEAKRRAEEEEARRREEEELKRQAEESATKLQEQALANASNDKKEIVNATAQATVANATAEKKETVNATTEAVATATSEKKAGANASASAEKKETVNATTQAVANTTNATQQVARNSTTTSKNGCSAKVISPEFELPVDTPTNAQGAVKFCGAGQLKVGTGGCPISGHAFNGTLETNGDASDCKTIECEAPPCCMHYKCGGTEIAWER